jgi:serine protease Do
MSAIRIAFTALLSCLAGIVLGFGVTGVAQRQAQAALDTPGDAPLMGALATAPSGVGPGSNFVTQVYKAVSPAVVHITNRNVQQRFDIFRGPMQAVSEAVGSGVIVEPTGYILTNYHVVEDVGEQQLTVVLSDQTRYEATMVGNDPSTDLALLKIEPDGSLPTAKLGDSNSIEIGEWVVAIGNPRGFDWTVTAGVVSAMNRAQPAWQKTNNFGQVTSVGPTITGLIQTDAAINQGNSGGPLLNARGEVIGINERIVSFSGGNEGIGLAIPSNTARSVIAELKKFGRVQRSWLGVEVLHEISPESAKHFNFPVQRGLMIGDVLPTSPAQQAGITQGYSDHRTYQFDIVSRVDGKVIKSKQDLLDIVRNRKPGQAVKLHIYKVRNGKVSEADVNVTLSAVPQKAEMSGYI